MLAGEHRKKLKSLCKTRWVERHEAFEVIADLFKPLVCCIYRVTKDILAYTKPLSVKLQDCYVDIVRTYGQIKIIETALKDARREIENCHSLIYAKAVQIAIKVHVSESLSRTAALQ